MAERKKRLSRVLLVFAVFVSSLAAITLRVIVAGEGELAASTAALEVGDGREAVVRARRAAGWYAPGAPHVAVAYERLVALAEGAEAHADDELAKLAWRAVRSAAIETRWLVTPHEADLDRANREIARLEAKVPGERDPDPQLRAAQLQNLLRHEPPRLGWIVALGLGFALAVVGFVVWSRRAASVGGAISAGGWPLVMTATGIALWLLAVWRG